MNTTLHNLSNNELALHQETLSLSGTIEQKAEKILTTGIYEKYKVIHNSYLKLFKTNSNYITKIESLKRLIFINWYALVEPGIYTRIGDLDVEIVLKSYIELDQYIINKKLDKEFMWMLSYYSCWDFAIVPFAEERKLKSLKNFVTSVDKSKIHVPKIQLLNSIMNNRGQMGNYWMSLSVEK